MNLFKKIIYLNVLDDKKEIYKENRTKVGIYC